MSHAAIEQIEKRVHLAKEDSDFTYFYALLLQGEALLKTVVLGAIAAIVNDPDRHRYALEYTVLKADGLGPWARAIEDAMNGPASQFLLTDFSQERTELTILSGNGSWQFQVVHCLKQCLDDLHIETKTLPLQVDLKQWFYLFATLRNKTRGHGATMPGKVAAAAVNLRNSIATFYKHYPLFARQWAYLYRNISGKYRVTPISQNVTDFDELKRVANKTYPDGVYLFAGIPRLVPFLQSDADLSDFFFPNGGFGKGKYEGLSYSTDNKCQGDASAHLAPPGTLPQSETQGLGELEPLGNCFSNAPSLPHDYISRTDLEAEITLLVEDDRHSIVTLLGRGGIGKTTLALKVLKNISSRNRFNALIWFSARDVDLQFSGPKPVTPHVLSPEEVSRLYVSLVAPDRMKESGFRCREFFEEQLNRNEIGPCLYVFDNFETTQRPEELFAWIDTHVRLPNKILITTRLRDFKGDYPVEVGGMIESEARELIKATADHLTITHLLSPAYVTELIHQAEGHPYVIKILLGEVAKAKHAGHIERLVAGRDEILTALFERTYASLSPYAQRIFMTLAAWNSPVPRVALEAVLQQSLGGIGEVEQSIDLLLQYSLAERRRSVEGMDFIGLPLVALMFGRKKLKISPFQAAIRADAELLQMLGTVNKGDIHLSLAKRIEYFLGSVARNMSEKGKSFDEYSPIIEMIARHFHPAWLSLARLHMEEKTASGYEKAKEELRRYLENDSTSEAAARAWSDLAYCCFNANDMLGDIHAFVQRSKIASVPFVDLSNTARLLDNFLKNRMLDVKSDEPSALGRELLSIAHRRIGEAMADDLAQMALLALRLDDRESAIMFVRRGLGKDKCHDLLTRLEADLGIAS